MIFSDAPWPSSAAVTSGYPEDDREILRGVARGECASLTAAKLGQRASNIARQRIALGLSEHEEFIGAVPLDQELLSM